MMKKNGQTLPDYTFGEELLNMISHIAGALLGMVVLTMCVARADAAGSTVGMVTSAIYGATMILLYAMSSIYHGLPKNRVKKVFRVLDHCTIYLLIAGTYTPITLCAICPQSPVIGWVVFGLEWGLAALALTLTAIDLKKFQAFSMVCYIIMGWCIIAVAPTVVNAISLPGFMLILSGGIAYTVGAVLYGIGKKKKYIHGVFHLFVLAGSFLQFLGVYLYCI